MITTLTGSMTRLRVRHGTKLLRFGAVSAFNVVLGQLLLFGAQVVAGLPPLGANSLSLSIGAIPAYYLSRYWVWEKRGKNHLMREVVPFWTLALIGFAVSTVAIWYVDARWSPEPLLINLTNLASYGVVWVMKFVVLDRVLFAEDPGAG